MPVYFVTGKLGAGKSLTAVGRIENYLNRGLPVATNLDINLKQMLGRNKKKTRLLRVPDKPEVEDLEALGYGNKSYDESKNGLLVLDECGTWFNSRTWGDKGRQAVINWLLHARKLGWDVIFIIQDLSIVDKQARLTLAEHVVYCRRTDRLNIPLIGTLFSWIAGGKIPLPKIHVGVVKYGDSPTALKVDTWVTVGSSLYYTYDTKQRFTDYYEHGVYSVLPPYYSHGRYSVKYNPRNIMRITKILFRKYNRLLMFALGCGLTFGSFYSQPAFRESVLGQDEGKEIQSEKVDIKPMFEGFKITGYSKLPSMEPIYTLTNGNEENSITIKTTDLVNNDFIVLPNGSCSVEIIKDESNVKISC